jgi:hypothetical protein
MSELIADLFISVDGCAKGSRSPLFRIRRLASTAGSARRWATATAPYGPEAYGPGRCRNPFTRGLASLAARPPRVLGPADRFWHATVSDDLVGTVGRLKAGDTDLRTIGSLSLVSQLLQAGLVDRLRLLVFPLIAGETGQEPAFAQLPDIGLDLVGHSVLDRQIVLSEYRPSGAPPYAS